MKLLPAYPGMRDSSQCVPHATVVLLARIPSLYLHWSGGLLVWIAIGLLSTPVQAASDVVKNDTVQEVAIAWSEEILNDFRDGTVFAVRLAEHVGKKAASLVPTLQVSSGFDMREFGLKPGKYWYGVRLPKKMSQLDLHNTKQSYRQFSAERRCRPSADQRPLLPRHYNWLSILKEKPFSRRKKVSNYESLFSLFRKAKL